MDRWRFRKRRTFARCKVLLKIQDDETHNWEAVRTRSFSKLGSSMINTVFQEEDEKVQLSLEKTGAREVRWEGLVLGRTR